MFKRPKINQFNPVTIIIPWGHRNRTLSSKSSPNLPSHQGLNSRPPIYIARLPSSDKDYPDAYGQVHLQPGWHWSLRLQWALILHWCSRAVGIQDSSIKTLRHGSSTAYQLYIRIPSVDFATIAGRIAWEVIWSLTQCRGGQLKCGFGLVACSISVTAAHPCANRAGTFLEWSVCTHIWAFGPALSQTDIQQAWSGLP